MTVLKCIICLYLFYFKCSRYADTISVEFLPDDSKYKVKREPKSFLRRHFHHGWHQLALIKRWLLFTLLLCSHAW